MIKRSSNNHEKAFTEIAFIFFLSHPQNLFSLRSFCGFVQPRFSIYTKYPYVSCNRHKSFEHEIGGISIRTFWLRKCETAMKRNEKAQKKAS